VNASGPGPGLKASLVIAVTFVLGMIAGAAADRIVRRPTPEPPLPPLTIQDMAHALALDPAERARVGAVLDSLRPEIASAAAQGPDSLELATRRARRRIADALPPGRRAQFQQWLDARHSHMIQMMRRFGPGMGPGMMGPGAAAPGFGRRMTGFGPGPGPGGRPAPGPDTAPPAGRAPTDTGPGPGATASMGSPAPRGGEPSRMGGGMMGRGMMGGMTAGVMSGGSATVGAAAPAAPGPSDGTVPAGSSTIAGAAGNRFALPDPDSPGARLVVARCSSCHTTPSPAVHTAEEWPAVVNVMRQRIHITGIGLLSDAEADTVLHYLQRHARH
jgi:hypothetical protein